MNDEQRKDQENLSDENLELPADDDFSALEKIESEEDRPWWKRMKRETGKVKDPYGRETRGVKWSVKGDGFLEEVLRAFKKWFG